ncbi:hypothetical protein GCM10020331_096020 [Ectobacillus funiculus]
MNDYPATFREEQLPSDYHNEFGLLFQGYRRLMNRIEELYRSLEEQHRRQRKAEILALQAMINPHFLYNTLDQVNWMAIEAGQEQISRVLELMGKMFRIGLSNGESVIRIEEELTHLECYMEIQQIRWGEGLTFTTEIPNHIKEYYIPKLTFQPFVENALMHGFHGRSTGSINIAAYEIEDDLLFTVSDNGVGIRADAEMNKKKKKTGGYGMRNVRERMESYFGHPYGIEVDSEEGKGTTISIRIPKLREKKYLGGGIVMCKIVIIDDERQVLQGMKRVIPWEELEAEWAGEAMDGEQGLELIRETQPDIVLTDIYMPVMNGLEMIEKLRHENFQGKIIILSGYSDFEYARHALRLNVHDYLSKPVTVQTIREVLQSAISKVEQEKYEKV